MTAGNRDQGCKNIIYGGNTILRNGSNSYRPLNVPEQSYAQ